jgi:predicted metal-binding protein
MAARFVEGPVSDFFKTFVDVPRFLACCKECPSYGKRWSCPPYDFSVEATWGRYSSILLYEEKIPVSAEFRLNVYEQEELNDICRTFLAPVKRQMTDDLLALERQFPESMALFPGRCELCDLCGKESGRVCRYPERMRYSIESLGGNVEQVVRILFDDRLLWAKDGHLPEYLILLGGLLKK